MKASGGIDAGVNTCAVRIEGRLAKRKAFFDATPDAPAKVSLRRKLIGWRTRPAFILPGRLVYKPLPGAHASSLAAALTCLQTFALSPSTRVATSAPQILDLAPAGGGSGLQLRFESAASLELWKAAIQAEVSAEPLADILGADFGSAVNRAVWDRLQRRGGDLPLRTFYHPTTVDPSVTARFVSQFHASFSGALGLHPSGAEAASTFAELLSKAAEWPAIRALLLSFRLHDRFFAGTSSLGPGAAPVSIVSGVQGNESALVGAFKAILGDLSSKCSGDWGRVAAPLLLRLLHFPSNSALGSVSEMAWYQESRELCAKLPVLTYPMLRELLQTDNAFIARIFLQVAVQYGDVKRLEDTISHLSAAESGFSKTLLRNCLKNGGKTGGCLLVEALVHPSSQDDASFTTLCRLAVRWDMIDSAFYAAFMSAALHQGHVDTLQRFLENVIFSDDSEFCSIAMAQRIPNLVPSTIESLFAALDSDQIDSRQEAVAAVVELVLRFEHLGLPDTAVMGLGNFTTLTKWLKTGLTVNAPAASAPASSHSGMFLTVLRDSHFLRFFAGICAPNEPLMLPPGVEAKATLLLHWEPAQSSWRDKLPRRGMSGGADPDDDVPSAPPLRPVMSRMHSVVRGLETDWKRRRRDHLLDELYGFFCVGVAAGDTSVIVEFLKLPDMSNFFSAFFNVGKAPFGLLRSRVVALLLEQGLRQSFADFMMRGELLTRAEHFSAAVLDALKLKRSRISEELLTSLTVAALRLRQERERDPSLSARLHAIDELSGREKEREKQLAAVTGAVLSRPESDLLLPPDYVGAISLEQISSCAGYATAAMRLVQRSATAGVRLQRMLTHYLSNAPVASWCGLFKSAETVAFFIKYLDREDLLMAHAAFMARASDESVKDMLRAVALHFSEPLVSSSMLQLDAGEEAIEVVIADLEKRGGEGTTQKQILMRLSAAWMRNRLKLISVPMVPRNCQSIVFLLAASWLRQRRGATVNIESLRGVPVTTENSRALIAQVGTGEGKSLIIAMIACYAVLGLGKKVHVLENNAGLMERDHADFVQFYESMGVSTAKGDLYADASVTYCLRRDIEHAYRDRVFAGKVPPFPNTILIVDEVDELIVDASPNMSYVKRDEDLSLGMGKALDAAMNGQTLAPDGVSEATWSRALEAYRNSEALKLKKNVAGGYGIVVNGSEHRAALLNSRAVPTTSWSTGLMALNYRLYRAEPSLLSEFFLQSMPHILSKYDGIIGLSGSLGSIAERAYLQATFRALFVEVPSFLDTCRDVRKEPPELIGGAVTVFPNEDTQLDEVARLSIQLSSQAPVVIITKNPGAARRTLKRVTDAGAGAFAQLFLQFDSDGKCMKWSELVEQSTLPIEVGKSGRQWRITVTDYFGGRGHDYRINDEEVNAAGGLVVIATSIPDSEREWAQWKGRTARNDRRGRFAVILSKADEPIAADPSVLDKPLPSAEHSYPPSLIDKLLKICDEKIKEKLANIGEQVRKGQRLNELCDLFYAKHGGGTGRWPGNNNQKRLRDFLEKWDVHRPEEVATLAVDTGLAPTVAAYKSGSVYTWP